MKNVLTVDLEDWFSVEAFNTVYHFRQWDELISVVEAATDRILEMFQQRGVRSTFFVLGWIADRYPQLVARVAAAGHEIACHSYYHRMTCSLTPEEFRKDTELAMMAINKACGARPLGYRSPSWGMRRDMTWAFKILVDMGFRYDSSIYPIKHDIYGDPSSPDTTFEINLNSGQKLIEIPGSTIKLFGRRIPIGGGGWLRQFPYWFTRWGIRRLNQKNIPAVVYFHPWELDPNIPRVKLDLKNRIRQYGSLGTMETKVASLLADFDFCSVAEYIDSLNNVKMGKRNED